MDSPVLEILTPRPKIRFRFEGKEYEITLPMVPSVAWLEDQLKQSMRHPWAWLGLKTEQVQAALQAGLMALYPEEAEGIAAKVATGLGPEEIQPVVDMLCAASFPQALGRFQAQCQRLEQAKREGKGSGENPQKKEPSADAL